MSPDLHCPLCGGTDAPLRYQESTLPIRRCACGMVFLYPQPTDEQLREMYRADYYRSWGISGDDDEAPRVMKQQTFMRQLEMLACHADPGRVLDVGCATGFFLEVAATAGWEVYGVELSTYAADLARRKAGAHVFTGTLEQAGYPDAFFDAVTLFDILEHVPEPRTFLHEVRRVLRSNGKLLLVTPNVASLSARLMGRHWSHYNAEHLHYFSPATIMRLLSHAGFVIECLGNAPKYLNFSYISGQLRKYPHRFMTPLCRFADALLPAGLKERNVRVHCGEMLVLAQKCDN